jgi:hypothetical protein
MSTVAYFAEYKHWLQFTRYSLMRCYKPQWRRGMPHAIFHWHAVWHAIVGIGCFVFWVLMNSLGYWGQTEAYGDKMEAEKRGRERIMETYDLERRDE